MGMKRLRWQTVNEKPVKAVQTRSSKPYQTQFRTLQDHQKPELNTHRKESALKVDIFTSTPATVRFMASITSSRSAHPRTVVLVDLENAAASTIPTVHDTQFVQVVLGDVVGRPDAQYIVATGTRSYQSAVFGWRNGRVYKRGGAHGAERELLEHAYSENLSARFDHVVIVSGDHEFTDYVSDLGRLGKFTTVVGWRGSIAASLRIAAHRVVYLDDIVNRYIPENKENDIA